MIEGAHGFFKGFAAEGIARDYGQVTDGLGETWQAENLAFKLYACGTMLKSIATAVLLVVLGGPASQEAPDVTAGLAAVIDGSAAISQQGFKVHISVDVEGIAGVVDSSHTSSGLTRRISHGR